MAFKSSKHQNVQSVQMVLNGGLNYSSTPSNLADNELRRAKNFIYDPTTDFLITRPGTACKTKLRCDGANPIIAVYYYEKSTSVAYLVVACNGHLYYLSGAGLDAWTEIGDLTDATTVPSFLTFNTKLLIADGGSAIRTWDGTTYSTIATSPKATALHMIKNRVVANAVDEPDSVYFSKTNDETDWNTSGDAVGLKAGFGDNLVVTAFGVFGDDLMVFKKGDALKRTYRINVAEATTSWYVKEVSANNSAQNSQATAEAWNNVFFVDTNGFKSVRGVDVYGDIQVDAIGRKINTIFTTNNLCDFMTYLPAYNAIWFGMGDRVFCYTERPSGDSTAPAFTDLLFKQGRIRAVCQAADIVYLAGHDGYLYMLDETPSTDATDYSTNASFPSEIRSKTLTFGGDGILRKLQFYLRPKAEGTASIVVKTSENTGTSVKSVALTGSGTELNDATGDLYDATGDLADEGGYAWVETSRNRIRSTQMAFEILVTSGRVGIEWIKAEIASVEGGD
jgi:hypothetical protein